MGEPAKLLVLEAILKTVKEEKLIENTQKTGDVLLKGLNDVSKQFPQLIQNVRGQGTFCAFDMPSASARDKYVAQMRNAGKIVRIYWNLFPILSRFAGIQMGSCGDVAVRFRPALIFSEKHVQIVLDKMQQVAKTF